MQLSQSAIETLVRDEKLNGLPEPKIEEKSVRAHKLEELNLAPMCREHHAIAHAIDAKVQEKMAR